MFMNTRPQASENKSLNFVDGQVLQINKLFYVKEAIISKSLVIDMPQLKQNVHITRDKNQKVFTSILKENSFLFKDGQSNNLVHV